MKSKQEFLDYYKSLTEHDTELKEREKTLVKPKLTEKPKFLIILPFLVPIMAFAAIAFGGFELLAVLPFLMFFIFIGLFVFLIINFAIPYLKNYRAFKIINDKYKEPLIKFLMEDKIYSYNKKEYINKKDFNKSKMFGYYNRYKGEDLTTVYIPNKNNDLFLRFSDLTVEEHETDKDGKSSTHTVFHGVFGFIEFSKTYDLSLSINCNGWFSGNERVELESIEFNKNYKVHSNDQILSRVILTPKRMEYMMKYKGKHSKIILVGNRIYFAFAGSDMFAPSVAEHAQEVSVDDFYEDVKNMNDMIEQVKQVLEVLD